MHCATEAEAAWAASGLMALSGPADGAPLVAARDYLGVLRTWTDRLAAASAAFGRKVDAGPMLLTERAALLGLQRQGACSAGGKARMLAAADGHVAVSLARPDDWDSVPAWLGLDAAEASWEAVAQAIRCRPKSSVCAEGQVLGIPVAEVPTRAPDSGGALHSQVAPPGAQRGAGGRPSRPPLVLDFSSLWAGPLCSHLLAQAGARVVKVESTRRPDGARATPAFFDLLHAGKEMLGLDFTDPGELALLRRLLQRADIVIEASRPRAFAQLRLDSEHFLAHRPGRTWVSITAYGRRGERSNWVGFGDDVAAAAGLLQADASGQPCFLGDAIADPLTGIAAAIGALEAHLDGGGRRVDVSMVDLATLVARAPRLARSTGSLVAAAPRARAVTGRAAACGAHTEALLRELAP